MAQNHGRPKKLARIQKPKFYPILPRGKGPKGHRRVDAIFVNTAVKVPEVRQADNLYKPFNVYTAHLIDVNTSATFFNDVRSGTKNPSWRVTIAKGGDATSSYSRTLYRIVPTKYSVVAEGLNNMSRGYGTYFGGLLRLENDTAQLKDQALARLKNKLQGKVGNASLAPPLAESREIHRLVRQINSLGMDALKAMLAAKKTKGKSVLKVASNIWLGLGFGVNPLLKDIKSAADAVMHYVTRQDHRIYLTGTASTEYHSGSRDTGSSISIAQDCQIGFARSASHTQGIRYGTCIDLKVRSGSDYSMADHLGLELGALPSTIWELTPFSWVVDYAATVGPWLDDMFFTVPGTVIYLYEDYKYQSETLSMPFTFQSAGTKVGFSGSTSKARMVVFSRTKLAPLLPARALRIKSADEIASHGLTKLLNLGSVLTGKIGPQLDTPIRGPRRRTRPA